MQAKLFTSIGLNLTTYRKSFEYDSIKESSVDLVSLAYVAILNVLVANNWSKHEDNASILKSARNEHQKHSDTNTCGTRISTPYNIFGALFSTAEANLLCICSVEDLSQLRLSRLI